jgi:NTE family protein
MTFADLKKPLSIMATEYDTFAPKILREGDVASAVLASLAIPGIVVPVERNMVEYVDGGVCDPLPVHVLLDDEKVDIVIAVNVLPTLEEFNHSRKLPKRHGLGKPIPLWKWPLRWLNRELNWFRRGNLLDILRSSAMASQMRIVEHAADRADVHIRPVDVHVRWHDYTSYKRYIKIGREAAEKALPEIRALLEAAKRRKMEEEDIECV